MKASVIVCTRNRSALLGGSLDSLSRQGFPAGEFEVLVVDNASTDGTAEVVASWQATSSTRSRYLREDRIGLDHARNRGIAEAAGEIIVFLDDDARADPIWLETLLATFADPSVSGAGGPVELLWEGPRPWWLYPGFHKLLAAFDLGHEACRVEKFPYLIGTNMGFTAETFRHFGGFHPDLDRRGRSLLSHGDTEFCHRVIQGGRIVRYEPRAIVRHVIPPDRQRFSFLIRRSYANGRSVCLYQRISGERTREDSTLRHVLWPLSTVPRCLGTGDWRATAQALANSAWHLGYLLEGRAGRSR
ncbi:MAG: hypothetical protein QOD06_2395 [Candidatus Binatota bacterium]|jgi:glycosyltransferase involved in cell wall biosynthesis|nr:hypothetical protein [Candidatus Binatota bacterium]